MSIEEQRIGAEPMERLKRIPLDSSKLDTTTKINTLTSPTLHRALIAFLKKNQDMFA